MNWLDAVERTVTALGYDLVDTERSAGGLLRVYIDRIPGKAYDTGVGEFIMVDDCEKVTRQLQQVLEVETAPYERLEVSSPGLDRPLKRESDYQRFVGEQVALTLKMPFQGRKKYQGVLERGDGEGQWRVVLAVEKKSKAVGGKGKSRLKALPQNTSEARLKPLLRKPDWATDRSLASLISTTAPVSWRPTATSRRLRMPIAGCWRSHRPT